ncbi:MAG: T9SS type A sorting domain-containing protein, partial [Bacteroidetes bacterium]|nr:T9SS type A sorting domain-containing protein [Bacteroidota bacterium]
SSSNYDEGAPESYAYGNCFYVTNGAGHYVRSVSFSLDGTQDESASAGIVLSIVLYKWTDVDNPDPDEVTAEHTEREFIDFTSYEIQGTELQDSVITLRFPEFGDPIELEDNSYYLLMVEYQAADQTSVWLGSSDIIDYQPMNFATGEAGAQRFGSFLGVPEDGVLSELSYGSVGFGWDLVPLVRMNVINESHLTKTEDVQVLRNEFALFPNPSNGQISVQMKLEDPAKNAIVRILDVAGRELMIREYENIQKERFHYNLEHFNNGIYMLEVVTEKGAGTKRFVIKN